MWCDFPEKYIYEKVAVGRKGSNLNMGQSLSMQHFLLVADQDLWFMELIYG